MTKNKRLFAILTLVCFMFTFMPVAAFADEEVNEAEVIKNVEVSTADELVAALESTTISAITFANDIKIDPANMSNAYGTTGINIKNGQAIDGAGYTLDIKGAGGTWDSGINTTGGLIKNLTVTGSFRGIFINHNSTHSERVVLENVTIDGTTYTISCDQGMEQGLTATDSTFNGWTSYAATLRDAKFVNCKFGEGNGYSFMRPYAPTEFVGCEFEAGFKMDPRAAVTFTSCTLGGVAITDENLATLVTSNIANAKVSIAKVGDNYYTSLQDAVDAAEAGATITLLSDATGSGLKINKNITIDLAGYTYTVNEAVGSSGTETLGLQLLKGNNIIIKNGTLTSAETVVEGSKDVKVLVMNYSNLTLDDVVLDGSKLQGIKYVMSNNNGNTTITGETNFIVPEGGVAFDVDYQTSYADGVSVKFDNEFTGLVNGPMVVEEHEKAKLTIEAGTFTATPSAYVVTGSCVSKTSPYVVSTTHTAGAPVEENRVEASYSAPGSYDSVVYCSACGVERSREAKTIAQLVAPYVPPVSSGGSSSSSSTPKVETETTVTPSGTKVETTTETKSDGTKVETTTTTTASGETTKVETTTETNKEGTKVETTVTTDSKGETSTTVTATLDNGSAVTNNDKAVEVEVTKVEETVVETVQEAVKADETVNVVGNADNAVSVSATNASTGAAQTDFVQPMSVNVPVDNTVLNNVEDTSKLTLAKVVTNEDGTTELVYMGGSYDEETGTFNAKVDEDGDYILVEKADLVKIELTIDDTTVKHNDKHHELDVAPAINAEAGRTELPLRYLGEALGFGIDWNNNVVTITKGDISFSLTIGEEIPGYGTPYLDSDRTMVSARYISEMLGANVIWDPVDRQVIVVK